MTDEMGIQKQRPSAIPYLTGGAAIGAASGAALAKYADIGYKAKYKSWQDAIKDATDKDSFVSKQIEKGGKNKASWETIQEQAKAVNEASSQLDKIKMPEGFEAEAELKNVVEKEIAVENAKKAIADKEKAVFETELANLKKLEIKAEEPYNFKGVDYNQEDFRKLLDSTKEEDKKIVEELVKDRKEYKDAIGNADFAKTEKEAVTKAEKALTEAEEALAKKDTKKLAGEVRETLSNATRNLNNAKKTAQEKLTEDLLNKCKKVNIGKTAAIGAAAIGLLALMFRPKGQE